MFMCVIGLGFIWVFRLILFIGLLIGLVMLLF